MNPSIVFLILYIALSANVHLLIIDIEYRLNNFKGRQRERERGRRNLKTIFVFSRRLWSTFLTRLIQSMCRTIVSFVNYINLGEMKLVLLSIATDIFNVICVFVLLYMRLMILYGYCMSRSHFRQVLPETGGAWCPVPGVRSPECGVLLLQTAQVLFANRVNILEQFKGRLGINGAIIFLLWEIFYVIIVCLPSNYIIFVLYLFILLLLLHFI